MDYIYRFFNYVKINGKVIKNKFNEEQTLDTFYLEKNGNVYFANVPLEYEDVFKEKCFPIIKNCSGYFHKNKIEFNARIGGHTNLHFD